MGNYNIAGKLPENVQEKAVQVFEIIDKKHQHFIDREAALRHWQI